jgi:hypothetical protein
MTKNKKLIMFHIGNTTRSSYKYHLISDRFAYMFTIDDIKNAIHSGQLAAKTDDMIGSGVDAGVFHTAYIALSLHSF